MQALEQQILSLQGQIEKQGNSIELLRSIQRDQFTDIKRRFSLLGNEGASQNGRSAGLAAESGPERSLFRQAYNRMKQNNFDVAREGFERYIGQYPNGGNLVDALYWFGELSLVTTPPSIAAAQRAFERIVNDKPDYKRMPGVLYKLAKIHHNRGNGAKARALLKQVIRNYGQSNNTAVKLSRAYLEQNFPRDG